MTFTVHSKKHGDHIVIIDDEDWEEVKKYKWFVQCRRGNKNPDKVYRNKYYGKIETIHYFITRYNITDHINGNALDNRKCNLRECTNVQNSRNKGARRDNKSGYKGVYLDKKSQKWVAQIGFDGKCKKIGRYNNKIDAARAYNEAATKYHGEFARLNII